MTDETDADDSFTIAVGDAEDRESMRRRARAIEKASNTKSTDETHPAVGFGTHEASLWCPDCGAELDSMFQQGDVLECYDCGEKWEVTVSLERQ